MMLNVKPGRLTYGPPRLELVGFLGRLGRISTVVDLKVDWHGAVRSNRRNIGSGQFCKDFLLRATTMYLITKVRNVFRRMLQSFGSTSIKKMMWNKEFAEGRWDHLAETPGDCVYQYVEKYSQGGDILDLGCGSGNTGNELDYSVYHSYIGIDISDVAIQKAVSRSELSGRIAKNRYIHSDITTYVPQGAYRVILFRESINYVAHMNIKRMLQRYRGYLDERGVLIVRLCDRYKYKIIIDIIRVNFHVLEEFLPRDLRVAVVIFR
jgi:SAM-dependent methyltransferase